jgi:hypothetical protein
MEMVGIDARRLDRSLQRLAKGEDAQQDVDDLLILIVAAWSANCEIGRTILLHHCR